MNNKLLTKENLKNTIGLLRADNKKIVMTNGCFDILHAGHVRYLKESKQFGDVLIVGLNSDKSVHSLKGDSRPINIEQDRIEVLSAIEFVDYIILFDELSPSKLLEDIKPDIYTKGADYNISTLPEAKVVLSYGGKVEFIKLLDGRSTTKIIEKSRRNNDFLSST